MPVRNTESRIPGGFDKAEALGQADISSDGNYALVSYLSSELQKIPDSLAANTYFVNNTYVVFVNTTKVAEPPEYHWKIEFFTNGEPESFHTIEKSTLYGELPVFIYGGLVQLDSDDQIVLPENEISRLKVQVGIDGASVTLSLYQDVIEPNSDIENLICEASNENIAKGGHPLTTRIIANEYSDCFPKPKKGGDVAVISGTAVELVTSVVYLNLLNTPFALIQEQTQLWAAYLNEGNGQDSLRRLPLGISQIRPQIISMFLNRAGGAEGETLMEVMPWDTNKVSKEKYESDLFDAFDTGVSTEEKIDLFNRLRFPKASIQLAGELLNKLQKSHTEWRGLRPEEAVDNQPCVETIVSEYEKGPCTTLKKLTQVAGKTFNLMRTSYIRAILASSLIPYEIIRLRVLDIRSGQPIKNARVKKLVIRSGDTIVGKKQDFAYDSKQTSGSIGLQSQYALLYLGYDPNGPSRDYGDTGRQRYKEYWDDRIPDGSVEEVISGNPPEFMLRLIINEYNWHRATDDKGILRVRIPTTLFQNKPIKIDVGFWEFPNAVEELANNAAQSPIRRSEYGESGVPPPSDGSDGKLPIEGATNFMITWIGDQSTDWDTNLLPSDAEPPGSHFGWEVKNGTHQSNLKVAQRLIVKEDEGPFEEINSALLSKYYDLSVGEERNHFVLFGMQWCQPVWDEFDDPASPTAGSITQKTYVQNAAYANLHMHLITSAIRKGPDTGSDLYGGKGRGKAEDREEPRWRKKKTTGTKVEHAGIDVHAKIGDSLFAIHGGRVTEVDERPTGWEWEDHKSIQIEWSGSGDYRCYEFFHLTSHDLKLNDIVMAGQVVAKAGRSGNLFWKSETPGHLHLSGGFPKPEILPLRNTPDEFNKITIPCNDYPLVFPCCCQVTAELTKSAEEISADAQTEDGVQELAQTAFISCGFQKAGIVNACWAAAELKCPHIVADDKSNIKLQVQLRYLNEKDETNVDGFEENKNSAYFHPGYDRCPGGVDGDIGTEPANVNVTDLTHGTQIERLSESQKNGKLIKIRHTQKDNQKIDGWIESSLIDNANKLNIPSLRNLISIDVSRARMAIYFFKKKQDLLNFEDYASNFKMSDADWIRLNEVAAVTTQS